MSLRRTVKTEKKV